MKRGKLEVIEHKVRREPHNSMSGKVYFYYKLCWLKEEHDLLEIEIFKSVTAFPRYYYVFADNKDIAEIRLHYGVLECKMNSSDEMVYEHEFTKKMSKGNFCDVVEEEHYIDLIVKKLAKTIVNKKECEEE